MSETTPTKQLEQADELAATGTSEVASEASAANTDVDVGRARSAPLQPGARRGEAGIALVMVVACLAIILPVVANFNFNARVEWQSSINHGDEIRARNVQRGAIQLSEILFMLQRRAFNNKMFIEFAGPMDITQIAPYLMSVFGTSDGAEGLGALVGLETSSLSELSLGENYGFEVRVEAVGGKVNVNCLAREPKPKSKNDARRRVVGALGSMMTPMLYDPLFEEDKLDGQKYTRDDVLAALVDYVDDDRYKYDVGMFRPSSLAERYRYEELVDPYMARNAPMDSIAELNLVAGVDDDWMAAFESQLTIYGRSSCLVNLNFASPEMIAAVITETVTAEDKWKTEGENAVLMTMRLANFIAQSRDFNLFKTPKDFQEMAAKPDGSMGLGGLLGQTEDQEMDTNLSQIPDGINLNLKGKTAPANAPAGAKAENTVGLEDIATTKPERVYSIEIITGAGAVRKRFVGVYDIRAGRSQGFGKGAWLHVSEL